MGWTDYRGVRRISGTAAGGFVPGGSVDVSAELVLPRSHRPGAFPRMYIARGEQLVFETKPSVLAFVDPIRIGILCLFFGIYGYIVYALGFLSIPGSSFLFDLVILIIVFGLIGAIAGGVVRWWATSYAVTDRRVLRSRGIVSRDAIDCPFDKIQNASLAQGIIGRVWGFGNVSFQTAGIRGLFGSSAGSVERAGGVYWAGVIDPVGTRRFVEELKDHMLRVSKTQDFAGMAQAMAGTAPELRISVDQPSVASQPVRASGSGIAGDQVLFCPRCGTRQVASAQYCHSCGSQLPCLTGQ